MSFRTAKVRVRYKNGEVKDSVGLPIMVGCGFPIQVLRKKSALQHRKIRHSSYYAGPSMYMTLRLTPVHGQNMII